jgi:8-amino-7-oxononanoate synthase
MEFTNLGKKHEAITIVDDAHGFGILESRNIATSYLVTPLGKAFGSVGAIISGANDLIEPLIQFARTYMYTTALPPAISYAGLAILKVISKESWRREKLKKIITFFIQQARLRNLPLISCDLTPIKCILIGDNETAVLIQEQLIKRGYFVSCIRPPTVPNNSARIRISLNCEHTETEIINLLDNLAEHYER